jgi:hypothetical protein
MPVLLVIVVEVLVLERVNVGELPARWRPSVGDDLVAVGFEELLLDDALGVRIKEERSVVDLALSVCTVEACLRGARSGVGATLGVVGVHASVASVLHFAIAFHAWLQVPLGGRYHVALFRLPVVLHCALFFHSG